MSIWSLLGIGNAIKGFKMVQDMGSSSSDYSSSTPVKLFSNWIKGKTGSGLTDAQVAENAYQTEMANTQYQRGVKDMQAAGLNPALLYGSGASPAPSPSGASVGSPTASFGELISALMLPMQFKQSLAQLALTKAQVDDVRAAAENKKADTNRKIVESESLQFDLDFAKELRSIRKQGEQNAVDLSSAQIRSIYKNIDKVDAEIGKIIAETDNEYERKQLIIWQTAYQRASAEQIEVMRPFEIAFKQAATAAQKASAAAAYANAAYQNALLDSGQVDLICENLRKEIERNGWLSDSAKADAFVKEYQLAIKTGNIDEFIIKFEAEYGTSPHGRDLGESVFAALNLVTSSIGNVFPKL